MNKEKLIKMLIEAKAKKAYFREKYNQAYFKNPEDGASFEYWKTKIEAIEDELENLE